MSEKTIGQRINAVRETCPYIQKTKKVETYVAVTHDQVTAELRKSLIEHGVLIVPQLTSGATVDSGKRTAKGSPIIRFEGVYAVGFVNVDKVTDAISIVVPAHAEDHGDKAPGKATSYAVKSAMLKMFSIETGEDDESRIQEEDVPPFSVTEWKQRMADATTVDALRKVTQEASHAAKAAGEDSKSMIDFGAACAKRLAKNPTAAAPVEPAEGVAAPAADPAPDQNPDAEGPDTDAAAKRGPPCSAAMLKMLRKALDGSKITEADLCKQYHVSRLDQIDKVEAAAAIKRASA